VEEQITFDRIVSLSEELVHGMEDRSFISEQQIMSVCKIQQWFLVERPQCVKQLTLQQLFLNASKQASEPEPQPSASGPFVSAGHS
jgi:hypothetical protein